MYVRGLSVRQPVRWLCQITSTALPLRCTLEKEAQNSLPPLFTPGQGLLAIVRLPHPTHVCNGDANWKQTPRRADRCIGVPATETTGMKMPARMGLISLSAIPRCVWLCKAGSGS
jgi:hypothetical protein